MFIEFHRTLIGDRRRNKAFYEALKRVIKPGVTTVADLGAGTGLLGFYAAKLGAKDVYFYEYSPALKLSQKLAKANGLRRCHFIRGNSRAIENPVPVDVVVSETLGNYAYEENIIENLADARRFLKPNGVMIPQHIAQFVAPVVTSRCYDELRAWDDVGADLDFTLAREMSLNNMYVRTLAAKDLLDSAASAKRWDAVDLRRKNASVRRGEARWTLAGDTKVYGFALWWECQLLEDIALSTSPLAPKTHWEQLYCPVHEPLAARAGDELAIALTSDSRFEVGASVKWEISLRSKKTGAVITQALDIKRGDIPG
jgi:protein arginine N-methyltransferase 1